MVMSCGDSDESSIRNSADPWGFAGTTTLTLVYGIGTAVPVLVVAFLLAYSANAVGKTYNMLSKIEWGARMTTGTVFILAGMWFSLRYVFDV